MPWRTRNRMTHCGCCGRELTDPESVERGIGPICWKKLDSEWKDAIEEERKKGSKEDNQYPTLLQYQRLIKGQCKCGGKLMPLDHYEHKGGYFIKDFEKRQWLYSKCEKCGDQWSFWKIRLGRISKCFICG